MICAKMETGVNGETPVDKLDEVAARAELARLAGLLAAANTAYHAKMRRRCRMRSMMRSNGAMPRSRRAFLISNDLTAPANRWARPGRGLWQNCPYGAYVVALQRF